MKTHISNFLSVEDSKVTVLFYILEKPGYESSYSDEKMTEVNYSPELDILTVDDTEQEYEKSVTSGDFIIDLTPQGEIRGLEIQNISKITGTDQKQLEKISKAEIETRKTGENTLITLKLEIEKQKTTLAAQLQNNQLKA